MINKNFKIPAISASLGVLKKGYQTNTGQTIIKKIN